MPPASRSPFRWHFPCFIAIRGGLENVKQARVFSDAARGHIEGISLPGLLQLLHAEGRSCSLRVISRGRRGALKLWRGELRDAAAGLLRGEEAACQVLAWADVEVRIEPRARRPADTIDQPIEYLLLESARREDEGSLRHHSEATLPPPLLAAI